MSESSVFIHPLAIVESAAIGLVLAVVFGQLFFTQISEFVRGVPGLTTSVIDWVNSRFGTAIDPNTISSKLNLDSSQIASWAGSLSGGVLGVVGGPGGEIAQQRR